MSIAAVVTATSYSCSRSGDLIPDAGPGMYVAIIAVAAVWTTAGVLARGFHEVDRPRADHKREKYS
jgi:hypothetical protein